MISKFPGRPLFHHQNQPDDCDDPRQEKFVKELEEQRAPTVPGIPLRGFAQQFITRLSFLGRGGFCTRIALSLLTAMVVGGWINAEFATGSHCYGAESVSCDTQRRLRDVSYPQGSDDSGSSEEQIQPSRRVIYKMPNSSFKTAGFAGSDIPAIEFLGRLAVGWALLFVGLCLLVSQSWLSFLGAALMALGAWWLWNHTFGLL